MNEIIQLTAVYWPVALCVFIFWLIAKIYMDHKRRNRVDAQCVVALSILLTIFMVFFYLLGAISFLISIIGGIIRMFK